MKFMYDPDHDRVIVESENALPFEITDKQAEIIAIRNISLALDGVAKALATATETLKNR